MDEACLEKLAGILIGVSVAGAAAAGTGVLAGLTEVGTGAAGLWLRLTGQRRRNADAVLAKLTQTIGQEWQAWGQTASFADDRLRASVVASFETVIPRCTIPAAAVVAVRLNADAVAGLVLAQAEVALPQVYADRNPRNVEAHHARMFLRDVTRRAYAALLAEPGYIDTIAPELWRGVLDGIGRIEEKIDQLATELRISNAERDALKTAADRAQQELGSTQSLLRGFLQNLLERDVPPDQFAPALFEAALKWNSAAQQNYALRHTHNRESHCLSKQFPSDGGALGSGIIPGVGVPWVWIVGAVLGAIVTGSRSPKSHSLSLIWQLDELRAKLESTYDAEDTEEVWSLLTSIEAKEQQALDALMDLLAYNRPEVAEQLAQFREGLMDTKRQKLDVALALFRAEAAATLMVELADLEAGGAATVSTLRDLWFEWYERGRDQGLNFDLAIAIELSTNTLPRANGSDDRGAILNDLGTALRTLGEREAGTARLEEAVAAYRAALTEYRQDRVPLDWARTLGNEGVALLTLADRTGDLGRARQALEQLTLAEATLRSGGHIPGADYYVGQIPPAGGLVDRLSAGPP